MSFKPGRLTDSTGSSASATLAALTNTTALTDSGGGTADNTVAAMAAPTTVTLADGVGTNDGAIPAITNNASTIVAVQELAASINSLNVLVTTIQNNFKEVTTQLALQRTWNTAVGNALASLASALNQVIDLQR